MNKLPLDILEVITLSNIPVYHLLLNSIPRLINKQGLHKRVVDKFTVKKVNNLYGYKEWCLNGVLHREDGPAVIFPDNRKFWYLNGVLHRVDGPAVMSSNGDKTWYLNGVLHREDGPAIIMSKGKYWYLNGVRHRKDGPAIIYSSGKEEYWLNGIKV